MLHPFMHLSLEDPVLMEAAPSVGNIQLPAESVEHWVGVEGGLFEVCAEQDVPWAIYARSLPRKPAGIAKKRRARAPPSTARPVTRSQAPRARTRVQTDRLGF